MIDQLTIKSSLSSTLKNYDIERVYLFGSYARGDQTPNSDIDLRFVCGNEITFGDLYEIQLALESQFEKDFDIVSATPDQLRARFFEHVKQDEVLVYEAV